ncbi:MAG TPA: hypothetical protein ENK91_16530, partial [Bacteroidetes bacterium]|nr:hypothetical protein [Bacteroidota bacterium]
MKNLISLLMVMAIVPMLFITGCKKDKVKTDFEILNEYAGLNNLVLSNVLDGWVIPASKLNVDPNDFSIPDY